MRWCDDYDNINIMSRDVMCHQDQLVSAARGQCQCCDQTMPTHVTMSQSSPEHHPPQIWSRHLSRGPINIRASVL